MFYEIVFKPQAIKDMKGIPLSMARIIFSKVELLRQDLGGDVKRLKKFFPKFRLRVGAYRVLFETESNTVIIYRVLHRRVSYD